MRKHFTLLFVSLLVSIGFLQAQTYCTAGASNCDEYISRVILGTIDNATGCGLGSGGVNNYSDYTAISTTLTPGSSSTITIYNGYYYTNDYSDVYIDWNADGDFYDANEYIGAGSGSATVTVTINTPSMPASFGNTRMRIRMRYGGSHDPCGNQTYGEVEDYTVYVPSPDPMEFDSIYANHPDTTDCFISQNLVTILEATISSKMGTYLPLSLDTVWFSTNGTSNTADIKQVRFFKSYSAPLNLANEYFAPQLMPNGDFFIVFDSGTVLKYGKNNIYVAYDASYQATPGNVFDCQLIAARVGDTIRYAGASGNPANNRKIVHPKNYNKYCEVNNATGLNYLAGLTRFTFENIDHTSGVPATTGNVVDFYTDAIATVYRKQTYPLVMQNAAFNNRGEKMYIDWDNNGYFDANEFYKYWTGLLPATIIKDNFTIPCNATTGYHRLRIVIDLEGYGGYTMAACGPVYGGEAEDYLLFVAPEDTPHVSFTPVAPLNYQGGLTKFAPESSVGGVLSYIWDYDNNTVWDDTTSSTGGFVFNSSGLKTVNLKAVLFGCTDTFEGPVFSDTLTLIAPTSPPDVNFITNLNTVTTSIPVNFTDLSTNGPNQWIWSITPVKASNGNIAYTLSDPTEQNPKVQFHELGDYTVKLVATNIIGTDSNT
ncbi:GEVED domain-containing protein, partial [Bacteroidota bacterium]